MFSSSGAQSPNGTGISAFYSQDKYLYVQVLDGHRKWFSKLEFELGTDWLNFGISWSRDQGLLVIINGHVKGERSIKATVGQGVLYKSSVVFSQLYIVSKIDVGHFNGTLKIGMSLIEYSY